MPRLARRVCRCFAWLLLLGTAAWPVLARDVIVHGAGATFPFPLYAQWAALCARDGGLVTRYEPVGSDAGVALVAGGRVDFGASDVPLSPADLARLGLMQFPAVVGGVVPVVNIAGVKPGELQLNGALLADIYLGRIKRWNERPIAELNPGLALPNANITVVHRAEASGSTFLWSSFLSRSSPAWNASLGAASVLSWPVGVAAVGNEGVASSVQRTKVSIGYVEYAYARQHRLSHVALRNRDGALVQPGAASFEAAMVAAGWHDDSSLDQWLIDQAGAGSWPVTGASFVLLRTGADALERSAAAVRFFDWALRHGQGAATALDYVPLPPAAVAWVRARWATLGNDGAGDNDATAATCHANP